MTELQERIRSGGLSTQAARSILILTSTGMTHTVYLNPRWLAGVIVWTGILLCLILLFSSKLQAYTDYFMHRQHILYRLGRCYILHMYISILHTVAGFSYFQFWCFQDTTALFNQFDPNSTTLSEFINVTDLQRLSALICAQTSVIREFIDEQLPWFQYQEWTWLAIGIITVIKIVCVVGLLILLLHIALYVIV